MSSSYGKILKLSVFGQSHSPAIGFTLDGLPAGFTVDMDKLLAFMSRRAPGKNEFSTMWGKVYEPWYVYGKINVSTF